MGTIKRILLYLLGGIIASLLFVYRRSLWAAIHSPTPTHLLIGIILLILLILIFIFFIFRSAKKEASPQPPDKIPFAKTDDLQKPEKGPPEKYGFSKRKLRLSFARNIKYLRDKVSGKNYRYDIPWFLMIGEAGAGKTTALRWIEPQSATSAIPAEGPYKTKNLCEWHFSDNGLVLDVAGTLVFRESLESPDTGAWPYLLRLLQKYRPRRPTDGIVLAISCENLIRTDPGKFEEKAELLYEKLRQAQKILGIHLPVYVLITKCDLVNGFQNFCHQLPKQMTHNIFGWSSPYKTDAAYSPDWADEAFQSIHSTLFRTQFEIFSNMTDVRESDALFSFPIHFQLLTKPIRIYLNSLFKKSVYHDESFIFRGLYFCGHGGTEASGTALSPLFVKDLFEKKIFSEFRLAWPLERELISRNRKVRAALAVAVVIAVVGGLGLWDAYRHLLRDKNNILPGFTQIREDFEASKAFEELNFEKSAQNLFDSMKNLRTLRYVFIPPSWFSDVHKEIRQSMLKAYNEIILKVIFKKLKEKAETIFFKTNHMSPQIRTDEDMVFIEKQRRLLNFASLSSLIFTGLSEMLPSSRNMRICTMIFVRPKI